MFTKAPPEEMISVYQAEGISIFFSFKSLDFF
jgi:hypothetical protein